MKLLELLGMAAIAGIAIGAEDPNGGAGKAPVLRKLEPDDSVVFRLPGPQPTAPAIRKLATTAPVAQPSPLPAKLELAALPPLPAAPRAALPPEAQQELATTAPVAQPSPLPAKLELAALPPLPAAPRAALPPEAQQDLAFYCQKQIGKWKHADVRKLLGVPRRTRPAFDEHKTANGRIYAFTDPTGRYRELELDFDNKSGTLRTVFGYPPKLTWQDVQRRWTGEVSAAQAPQGRTFYSYVNRRMDVLVDSQGKVISLGLY